MSDRPQGEDWWLASDGKWYPPESRPAPPQAPQPPQPPQAPMAYYPPQPTGVSRGLSTTVRIFMFITALAAVIAVTFQILEIPKFDAYMNAPEPATAEFEAWGDASTLAGGAFGFVVLGLLVLWILLMVWGSQAHRSLSRFGPSGTSWSPGWAVGGWFIPLANAVIPRLVFNEIERVADPENGPAPIGDAWRRRHLTGTGLGWWIVYVAGYVIFLAGFGVSSAGTEVVFGESFITDPDMYRAGLVVSTVGLVGVAISHVLGGLYFGMMGNRLGRD